MHPQPLDKNTRKSNATLAISLAVLVLVLVGLAVYFVSPEAAGDTDSFLSRMR